MAAWCMAAREVDDGGLDFARSDPTANDEPMDAPRPQGLLTEAV
jgi:hypothetical protein